MLYDHADFQIRNDQLLRKNPWIHSIGGLFRTIETLQQGRVLQNNLTRSLSTISNKKLCQDNFQGLSSDKLCNYVLLRSYAAKSGFNIMKLNCLPVWPPSPLCEKKVSL